MGMLCYGDNLDILRRYLKDESVVLVYLDPPFNSEQSYSAFFHEKDGTDAASQIRAFEDTWHWDIETKRAYDAGTYDGSATSTVEWQVTGVDADFVHSAPADPSGNALGPFTVGSTVKLRTRVTNGTGTTTVSVRTLTAA